MKRVIFPKCERADPAQVLCDHMLAGGVQGMTLGEMELRLTVAGKLRAAGTAGAAFVDLEDAEHAALRAVIENTRFNFAHMDFVLIGKAVKDASAPPPPAPKAEPEMKAAE